MHRDLRPRVYEGGGSEALSGQTVDVMDALNSSRPLAFRIATLTAGLAFVFLVGSIVLFAMPVTNAGVQRCGSPAWFLLRATTDRPLIDAQGNAINDWDEAQLRKANAQRCSKLVAQRAVPAGYLLGGFWLVSAISLAIGFSANRSERRRLRDDQPGRTMRIGPPSM